MSRSPAARRAVTLLCALALPSLASAQAFSPAKGVATLTVKATLAGQGIDRPASHTKNVTWTVEDVYEIKATMTARAPSGFVALKKPDAAAQAREAQRAANVKAATANAGDMMAQAQAAQAKCGDNQDCLMREVMKMSQNIDPNSPQLQAAKAQADAATAVPRNRYQLFEPQQQAGSFRVEEKAHEAYYDAACKPSTEATCSIDTRVTGGGAQRDPKGALSYATGAMAEWDATAGTLTLMLPATMPGEVQRDVISTRSEKKSGKANEWRSAPIELYKDVQMATCGDCKAAAGKFSVPVKDALLGRPATLTVEWKFERP